MKKFIFSLIVLAIALLFFKCKDQLVSPYGFHTPPLNSAEKSVASSSGVFGLKLFKAVNEYEGDKNIFISPLSVSMALGMTLNGANGTTYDSMSKVLELNSLTQKEINEAYKNLLNILANLDSKIDFSIANSIWYRNTMAFEEEFISTNKTYFNAEVSGLDFNNPASVDIINSWVDQNTKGKINKIIDNISSNAVMYLINAIYFKGNWKYQFNKNYTEDDFFILIDGSKAQCKMMEQGNYFNYFANDLFQAAELPYGDSSFSMIIFLPNNVNDINNIISQFNQANWNSWLGSFVEKEGDIWMPKFELKYEITLNDVFTALGMGISFSDFADFSKIFSKGGLAISEVLHKTYVKVDEEGTEAAAVTFIGVGTTSTGSSKFYMRIDKPFLFVIKDNQTNSLLFMGKIINPEQ